MAVPVIATLTTIPSRIHLLGPVIHAIRSQTYPVASIELNIPWHCKRLNQIYEIPEYLLKDPGLTIFRTEDLGPITKILPTLIRYEENLTNHIWSVDDDVILKNTTLMTLAEAIEPEKPKIFTGKGGEINQGWDLKPWWGYGRCTLIEAYGSVLYPPGIISKVKDNFLTLLGSGDEDIIFSDDILLSMVFGLSGIEIFLRNPRDDSMEFLDSTKTDALHEQDQYNRYHRAWEKINRFYASN